ncbi:MAG: putative sulfate exporter family transporter, partial [Peptococcus niger]
PEVNDAINAAIIGPIKSLRTWSFVFCFLCIGLTTRFKELASVGMKPVGAFSIGVLVNVLLGFLFSVLILGHYWTNITQVFAG